ncbi:hypothetical protein [Streptomyces sp. NPDC102264]|uniref:hypothetical protein n=1 Tax=Streptomyces sp. NPDC102264 TaxID=3366149 RepID=UPI0037FA1A1D
MLSLRARQVTGCQAIALVSRITMINATNRLGVILNNQGGAYEPGALAGVTS